MLVNATEYIRTRIRWWFFGRLLCSSLSFGLVLQHSLLSSLCKTNMVWNIHLWAHHCHPANTRIRNDSQILFKLNEHFLRFYRRPSSECERTVRKTVYTTAFSTICLCSDYNVNASLQLSLIKILIITFWKFSCFQLCIDNSVPSLECISRITVSTTF